MLISNQIKTTEHQLLYVDLKIKAWATDRRNRTNNKQEYIYIYIYMTVYIPTKRCFLESSVAIVTLLVLSITCVYALFSSMWAHPTHHYISLI